MIQFDKHIFQMARFNHQLEIMAYRNINLPLDPKTMKNEGFTPQYVGYNP